VAQAIGILCEGRVAARGWGWPLAPGLVAWKTTPDGEFGWGGTSVKA